MIMEHTGSQGAAKKVTSKHEILLMLYLLGRGLLCSYEVLRIYNKVTSSVS